MIYKFLKIQVGSNRIYGLDILRAIAILFVVFKHGERLLPDNFHVFHELFLFDGVSIFFVLSGFLIGGILIKIVESQHVNRNTLYNFWKRRWFRTLPNYFLILIIITSYFLYTKSNFRLFDIKEYFVFCQNLFSPHPNFFSEAWSLSVEEWFYLLIPIFIFQLITIFKFKPKNAVLISAITILSAVFIFRTFRYLSIDIETINDWDLLFRKQVFTRLDSLMFGVLGAYFQFYYPSLWILIKTPTFYLGIISFIIIKFISLNNLAPINSFYLCVLSFSITSIGTLLLLPYLSSLKTGSGKVYKLITTISLISYSMYLLNLTIVQKMIIKEIIPWHFLPNIDFLTVLSKYLIFWFITVIGSIIIYKYFEIPITNMRDKNFYKTLSKLLV